MADTRVTFQRVHVRTQSKNNMQICTCTRICICVNTTYRSNCKASCASTMMPESPFEDPTPPSPSWSRGLQWLRAFKDWHFWRAPVAFSCCQFGLCALLHLRCLHGTLSCDVKFPTGDAVGGWRWSYRCSCAGICSTWMVIQSKNTQSSWCCAFTMARAGIQIICANARRKRHYW